MVQAVLTVAGYVVGSYFGYPQLGAIVGAAVGAYIAAPDAPEPPKVNDLKAPQVQYGSKLLRLYGSNRTSGSLAWYSTKRVIPGNAGGKGEPDAPTADTAEIDVFYIVSIDSDVIAVTRIWKNGELVWTIRSDSDADSIYASGQTDAWAAVEFLDGNPAQLPHPVMEAEEGIGNVPAYRYRQGILVTSLNLGQSGQLPLLEFEVITSGTSAPTPSRTTVTAPWNYFGPHTAFEEPGTPTSEFIYDSAVTAAATRFESWKPAYTGGFTVCSAPTWYFLATGNQTLPSESYIIDHDGELSVQYICSGVDGQQGTVTGTVSTFTLPDTITPGTVDLADIVAAELQRVNLVIDVDFDVSELVGIPVRGFQTSGSVLGSLTALAPIFHFGSVCSDKWYFRLLGGASVRTLAFEDLAAGEDKAADEPFATETANDLEIAQRKLLTYLNIDDDYAQGTESGSRNSDSSITDALSTNVVMNPSEAKAAVETLAALAGISALTAQISLTDYHVELEPTDSFVVPDQDGNLYRMRSTRETFGGGLHGHDLVRDDIHALVGSGITTEDYSQSLTVLLPVEVDLLLVDGPIGRDVDNDSGVYAAAKTESGGRWRGAAIYTSADDITYSSDATVSEQAIFGDATSILGDWTGPRVFDEVNSVTVNVGDGELSSSTRDVLLNDQTVNAFALGVDGRWEYGQFRDAELVTTGVYRLTGFLRGSRGTEWAMTGHVGGETFLLATTALRRVPVQTSQLGVARYYKGVGVGRSVASVDSTTLTDNGVGLKPFSPFDVRQRPDGSDIVLTWQRRTRGSVRTIGPLGIAVPIFEESERYTVVLYTDSTFATVLRTLADVTTTTATYTAAQQSADSYTPSDPLYVHVYQLSAVVGRGVPAEATL